MHSSIHPSLPSKSPPVHLSHTNTEKKIHALVLNATFAEAFQAFIANWSANSPGHPSSPPLCVLQGIQFCLSTGNEGYVPHS